jgi:addiction module HigA family antidote
MRMHNPPHAGEIVRALCLEPLGLSVTEAAQALGVSRKTLSSLVNGRSGISAEMAIRDAARQKHNQNANRGDGRVGACATFARRDARSPHRTGRADFPHPALAVTVTAGLSQGSPVETYR